jgi:hypothetical protein
VLWDDLAGFSERLIRLGRYRVSTVLEVRPEYVRCEGSGYLPLRAWGERISVEIVGMAVTMWEKLARLGCGSLSELMMDR